MIEVIPIEILNTGHITNCYLYYNEDKEAILIDAPDKSEVILKRVVELNLDLRYILLTHAHADHTMALNELMEKTSVVVIANENEKNTLDSKISDGSNFFGTVQLKKDVSKIKFVKDGDSIHLREDKIEVISTPGHTSGSTSYYINKENVLFTGDALFYNCVGRWDLETASLDDTVKTVIKLYSMFKNRETKIYPGHDKFGINIKDTYFPVSRIIFNNTGIDLDMIDFGGKNESF